MLRKKIIDVLIGLLSRELSTVPRETLIKEQYDGMLAQLWENPAFRKYVADRDTKLVWTMAGGEGLAAEPRDAYVMHTGQRVELLVLAREAKKAFERNQSQMRHKVVD